MNIDDFSSLKAFRVSVDENAVAEISLNRPDAINSMNADFWQELPAIIQALDEQSRFAVIILSSEGKHFTAGMDLSVFQIWGPILKQSLPVPLKNCAAGFSACRRPLRTGKSTHAGYRGHSGSLHWWRCRYDLCG